MGLIRKQYGEIPTKSLENLRLVVKIRHSGVTWNTHFILGLIVKTNASWAASDNKQKDYTMFALKGTLNQL